MSLIRSIASWFSRLFVREPMPRRAVFIEADELPEEVDAYNVTIAREKETLWVAGLYCPCGCGKKLQLMLLEGVRPRWDVEVDQAGRVSLHPSVWLSAGCKSHFWLRRGQVQWCR